MTAVLQPFLDEYGQLLNAATGTISAFANSRDRLSINAYDLLNPYLYPHPIANPGYFPYQYPVTVPPANATPYQGAPEPGNLGVLLGVGVVALLVFMTLK